MPKKSFPFSQLWLSPSQTSSSSSTTQSSSSRQSHDRNDSKKANYNYAINLRVDPVELGFTCGNDRWHQEFKGLGAFNQYFAMLAPRKNGYTLPDVWDGYYQMTLVKFNTSLPAKQIKERLTVFQPSLDKLQLDKAIFRSSELVRHSGEHRHGDRCGTDYIALRVTRPRDFMFEPLLNNLQQEIPITRWIQTSADDLHINLRLYPNEPSSSASVDDQMTWTWERIQECGMVDKVARLPIDFYCATLELIPTRRQCREEYQKSNLDQWWCGVTDINRKCSGCQNPIDDKWIGACLNCGCYERIAPIWSIAHPDTLTLGQKAGQMTPNKSS